MKRVFSFLLFSFACEIAKPQTNHSCKASYGFDCVLNNVRIGENYTILMPGNKTTNDIKILKIEWSTFEKNIAAISGFENLTKLVIVNCTGVNNLKDLSFGEKLVELQITSSGLENIDKEKFTLENRIKNLFINSNGIKSVDKNAFKNLGHVIMIDLSFNEISWLHPDTYASCSNLEVINLTSNSLKIISFAMFSQNLKLREIFMAANQIIAIEGSSEVIQKKLHLTKLDLSGNLCKSVGMDQNAERNNESDDCSENFVLLQNRNETMKMFLRKNLNESEKSFEQRINQKDEEIRKMLGKVEIYTKMIATLDIETTRNRQVWKKKQDENFKNFKENLQKNFTTFKSSEALSGESSEEDSCGNNFMLLAFIILPLVVFVFFEPRNCFKKREKCCNTKESKESSEMIEINSDVTDEV